MKMDTQKFATKEKRKEKEKKRREEGGIVAKAIPVAPM